jgi:hypothetical protein
MQTFTKLLAAILVKVVLQYDVNHSLKFQNHIRNLLEENAVSYTVRNSTVPLVFSAR